MAKRVKATAPKKAPPAPKIRWRGQDKCHVCGKDRPGGAQTVLPWGWTNHVVNDDRYERGYWLPLTCSDECRRKREEEQSGRKTEARS